MSVRTRVSYKSLVKIVILVWLFVWLLIIMVPFMIYAQLTQTRQADQKPIPKIAQHTSPDLPSLWELHDISIGDGRQSLLVAQDGKVLLVGTNEPERDWRYATDWKVIALNGTTGQEVWTYENMSLTTLVSSQSRLFVGGIGQVTAIDLEDGKVVWSTQLPLWKSVTRLFVRDEIVYADILNSQYSLLDIQDGNILATHKYDDAALPFWGREFSAPGFIESIMYVYRENANQFLENGIIAAIDTASGSELWRSNTFVISNFSVTRNYVYALSINGELLRFDPFTGLASTLFRVLPVPIKSKYVDGEGTYRYYNYVAVDGNDQFLYLYLGDSQQLMAYKIKDHEIGR